MLLGMDWLYLHGTKVDYYDKAIECVDDNGEPRVLQRKKNATLVRMVTSLQEKCSRRKDVCYLQYTFLVKKVEVEDVHVLRRYPVPQQFQDVFPKEISEFPPHREVEISIELVPGAAPSSKETYRMSTPEPVELKLH